jgi:hypothetical protein
VPGRPGSRVWERNPRHRDFERALWNSDHDQGSPDG